MKRTLTQKLGLLGLISFFSYAAAVVFSPLAYPGYDWRAQASAISARQMPRRWRSGTSSAPFTIPARWSA